MIKERMIYLTALLMVAEIRRREPFSSFLCLNLNICPLSLLRISSHTFLSFKTLNSNLIQFSAELLKLHSKIISVY